MSNGLIDKAFLSGTGDAALYQRKYAAILRKPAGGYQIQSTPQEVAAVITQSRAWVKGHRMLCVGSETLGAERFIAENLGLMDVEYIGSALDHNAGELKAKPVKAPSGTYDVITVYGTAKVDALLPFTKIGTLVVFIGVGVKAKNPALRQSWLSIRKKHMAMLQTGGDEWQTGVGVVKILFVNGQDVAKPEVNDGKTGEAEKEAGFSDGKAESKDAAILHTAADSVDNGRGIVDDVPTQKRRGRQPGSKNKVKA